MGMGFGSLVRFRFHWLRLKSACRGSAVPGGDGRRAAASGSALARWLRKRPRLRPSPPFTIAFRTGMGGEEKGFDYDGGVLARGPGGGWLGRIVFQGRIHGNDGDGFGNDGMDEHRKPSVDQDEKQDQVK